MANPPDGDGGVGGEVLRLDKVVSQKFVPEPKDAQPILRSLFVALGRFEHCVRWKKFHFDRYVEEQTKARGETLNLLSGSDVSGSSQESDSSRQVRRSERIRELEEKRIQKLAVEFADANDDPGDDEKDPGTGLKAEGSEPIAPIADSDLAKDGEWTTKDLNQWLAKFQNKVNRMCGSSHLKFEMVVWANGRNVGPQYKRVKVHNGDSFPYLDTKIWYSEEGRLKWGLYKKPNQILKYLNGGSTHTQACKDAISKGVFDRAVRLTYLEGKYYDTPVNELFEEQAKALEVAQVAPNPYPTVYQVAQRLWKNAHRKDTRIQIPPKFKSKVDNDDDDSTIETALTDDDSFLTTSESSISSNDSTVIAANTKAAKKKSKRKRRARKKKRKRKPRGVNFVIPYSTFWSGEPIHAVIKRLKDGLLADANLNTKSHT